MHSTAPLAALYVSALNVRKTDRALDIEPLADNIAAHGLIEPLVVVDEGKGHGALGVIAGGRRYLALQLLANGGEWPVGKLDVMAIPVSIRGLDEAREISLSENVHSVVMNPVDELEAYAAIIADYAAGGEADEEARIARCARHFGKTERYVEQRLRLAALAPEIRDALRAGTIGLDVAKAYATVADPELQRQVFAGQEAQRGHSVSAIRRAMAGRTYRTTDRWVVYAGLDDYVAAGGRLDRDLFMGVEQGSLVLDTAIIDRLCTEKGDAEAQRCAPESGFGAGILRGWGDASCMWPRTPPGCERVYALSDLTPEERAASTVLCAITPDGKRVKATDEGFRPIRQLQESNAASASAAAASGFLPLRTGATAAATPAKAESEIERLARIRRAKIEAAALRLAFPRFEGTPLDGRAYWAPAEVFDDPRGTLPAVQEDEDHYAVAVYVRIPKADVHRAMDDAEAQVDGLPPKRRSTEDWTEETPPEALTAPELADMIDKRFAVVSYEDDYDGGRAAERFALDLIAELQRDHGARYRSTGHTDVLTLAGITCSCTAGRRALLRAWARKAREADTAAAPAELETAL
ncbi:MAG TPA: ParB/RepB/Spo0J family partition protein [Allosphingosinicella sp.]|jgi:ParB family chromosome partitioning protein